MNRIVVIANKYILKRQLVWIVSLLLLLVVVLLVTILGLVQVNRTLAQQVESPLVLQTGIETQAKMSRAENKLIQEGLEHLNEEFSSFKEEVRDMLKVSNVKNQPQVGQYIDQPKKLSSLTEELAILNERLRVSLNPRR